jgi:hypothetical protein
MGFSSPPEHGEETAIAYGHPFVAPPDASIYPGRQLAASGTN